MRHLRRLSPLLIALIVPAAAHAQKHVLTQADWDRWRTIQTPTLSNDGKWAAYTLSPQVGDGEFVVRSTSGSTEYRVPVGYISRPNNTPGGLRGAAGAAGGGAPAGRGGGGGAGGPFSYDSKYAFVSVQPNKEEVDRAARATAAARGGRGTTTPAAAPADSAGKNSLVMISLADGMQTSMDNVPSYRLPRYSAAWMIYTVRDSAAGRTATDSTGRGGRGGGAQAGPRRTYGTAIMLRNMATGADEKLTDVLAYTFDDSAKVLAYTVASHDSTKDGVYIRNLGTGVTQTVTSGQGNYRSFAFDRAQQQFVFTSDHDEFGKKDARATVYYGTLKNGTAQPIISGAIMPPNMHLADNTGATFTRNGNALTVTIAPPAPDSIPRDSLVGKATYDLWNYKDPQLQPAQLLTVGRDRNKTYQALYNLGTKKLTQLSSDSMPSVILSDDAKVGLASTSVAYDISKMWGDEGNDIYVVDPSTGARKLVKLKISGAAQLSVEGKFVVYFDEGHWYSYHVATSRTVDLTTPIKGAHFDQETWSTPDTPAAWGTGGWTKGDRSILLYDRYDIWDVDPLGVRPAVMVTDSLGAREHIQFRPITLDRAPDERAIDPTKPLWLHAFNEDTKASGFYRDRLDANQAPEQVVMADVAYGNPTKARNADVYMLTKSTFVDFPNLWVGPNLTSITKITDANPWQKDYNWGTAELVSWLSSDGIPMKGILYKPENFDPKKKYPMVSYFYEDLSNGLHGYAAPTGRNVINATHYVSNGYLIFEPDIHYEIGYPGPSAVKSIVPGVQMLLARGYVDPKGLGLQGQSWGGYQAAFIITQTSLFSAAMAGAPVANMTSAYGGIRWGSGLARAFQYEKTQSRLGKSIWDAPNLYIENSPLFWLPRVTTPLFIMSNDKDDAVPWYQGIELFVGMRRLGKEVYLVNYNDDVHNPASRANQKDVALKMQQFFDNKLMGKPAPDWMTKGIPAKDKGRDQVMMAPAGGVPATATGGGN